MMHFPSQIYKRSICKAGYDVDGVTGNADLENDFQWIKSQKGTEVIKNGV